MEEKELISQKEFLFEFDNYLHANFMDEDYMEDNFEELNKMLKMDIEEFMESYSGEFDCSSEDCEYENFEINDFLKDEIDDIIRKFIDEVNEQFENF